MKRTTPAPNGSKHRSKLNILTTTSAAGPDPRHRPASDGYDHDSAHHVAIGSSLHPQPTRTAPATLTRATLFMLLLLRGEGEEVDGTVYRNERIADAGVEPQDDDIISLREYFIEPPLDHAVVDVKQTNQVAQFRVPTLP